VFWYIIINIVRDTVAGSYNFLKLNTKVIVKEVAELLKDNRFTLGGPVSTPPFIIPN
jgi:hypothetical protein